MIYLLYLSLIEPPVQGDTCQPSPCGPYSNCRVIDNHAVCSCQPNYIGSPPSCRPECVVSTDCSPNMACINQRCKDPCIGTCGVNADCRVINHNPVCICAIGYSGDPFFGCVKEGKSQVYLNHCLNIFVFLVYFEYLKDLYNILNVIILFCEIVI